MILFSIVISMTDVTQETKDMHFFGLIFIVMYVFNQNYQIHSISTRVAEHFYTCCLNLNNVYLL